MLVQVISEYELSAADLLAGRWDPVGAIGRAFSVHLLSFVITVALCLVAGLRLHGLFAHLGGALAAAEWRSAELGVVNELSRTLAGNLDTDGIGFELTRAMQAALGADAATTMGLYLFDDEAQALRPLAQLGPHADGMGGGTLTVGALASEVKKKIIDEHEVFVIADTDTDPAGWSAVARAGPGDLATARSYAALPLVTREQLVAIVILHDDRPGFLDPERLRILTILAQAVSGTLLAAREVGAAEARAQREAVANKVANLTLSTLDADSILSGAAATLGGAMKASRALIWTGESPASLRVQHEWTAELVASVGAGLKQAPMARLAAREGRTVAITDCRDDPRLEDGSLRLAGDPRDAGDTLAALATRISLSGQLIGVLVVEQVNRTRAWTPADVRLIEAVARELRVSVETVRMFEARRHESERMVALSRVSAKLAAQTDPSMVLEEVMRNAVQLVGHASGSLFIWVEEAKVLRAVRQYNMPEGATLLSLRSGQGVAGKAFADLAPVIINDYQHWEGALPSLCAAGERAAIAVPLLRSGQPLGALVIQSFDGSTVFTEEDARLLALFADQAVSALTSAEAFQKQAAAVEDLERLSKAKSDFISIVSHEFRTPLTGIQGFSEMMRDENLSPEEMKEYANDIYKDARRLNRMINEMLDLDRMESGRMQLIPEAVDLNEIIRDTVERMAPNTPKHPITVDLGALPVLMGDRDKLVQIMTNLLSNAVKYSPDGGAIVITSRHEGALAHVTVRDHGLGIPADSLEKIFERFSRIETETTRYIQGTGLGLPIVRQIAEMHGGRVWAESTLGAGSTFHVTLPVAPVAV